MENSLAKVVDQRVENGKQQLLIELDNPVSDFSLQRYQRDGEIKVKVEMFDNRYLSPQQNDKIHAIIRDIYREKKEDFNFEETKERVKTSYCKVKGIEYFSLAKCSMTFAREFINFLLLIVHEMGIQTSLPTRQLTDDASMQVYMSLVKRKCAVCDHVGEGNQIHHYDAIGMGLDRTEFDHTKSRLICLCAKHHEETHTIGLDTFFNKYYVEGIKVTQQDLDQIIKYPYEVKTRKYSKEQLSNHGLPEIYEKIN